LLAAKLATTEHNITCIARGAHLKSIQSNGLLLIDNNRESIAHVDATDDPTTLPTQDIVFVALKTHALAASAEQIAGLLGPNSVVVTMQNGLPWWYFHPAPANVMAPLQAVDPGGVLAKTLNPARALGAIVYPAAQIVEPGVIRHVSGNRFSLGEPDNLLSDRLKDLETLLVSSGFEVTPSDNIRAELWLKLSVNAGINPLSLLHKATIGELLDNSATRKLLATLIGEAQQVALSVGIEPIMTPAALVDVLEVVRDHKTSMLTDFEKQRPLELEALTGAVVELAARLNVPVPALTFLYGEALNLKR
jgi:2-dehydropantoate 2-reductase